MSKSLSEFKRFLGKSQTGFSEYEKKLCRLILDNFTKVESLGTAGGKRGKQIAKLIEEVGDSASSELNIEIETSADDQGKIVRLSSIKVQNFRGFSTEHLLEFKNPYTFVYGPNGTGKSSLCEALEYGLLGSINEADSKRIDIASYIKNSITKKTNLPILLGVSADGKKDIPVKADPKNYEFCFIEKNRIDGFARVAANAAAAQQVRLASLFGLEEFNAFSTQFNDNFENYLDCTGKKTKELADKEKQIGGHRIILSQIPEKEKNAKAKADALLLKYENCKTLEEVKAHISGSEGNGGLMKKNNTEIGRLTNLKTTIDPGVDAILKEAANLVAFVEERRTAKQFLAAYKDQLSLGSLYTAILDNRDKYKNKCPACESSLYDGDLLIVPKNPYQNATEKLKQFEVAIKKEARIAEITELLKTRWNSLNLKIVNLSPVAVAIGFAQTQEIGVLTDTALTVENSKTLEPAMNICIGQTAILNSFRLAITAFNQKITTSKAEINKLEDANRILSKHLEEIVAINTTIKANITSVVTANLAIEKFKSENEELIKQVEKEKPVVARNMKYLVAYESFREKLLKYNANLPLTLAADLNEKTLNFYNAINKDDHISDRLKSLTLPTTIGKKIEIEFEIGQKYDALQILSEGHIRCLGLAILLAKIVRDDLPFLIFDDVVNSIDDEHRGGIVALVLGDEEIKKRQLIITTHGEDFMKRLENAIPKSEYKSKITRIDFLPPEESKKIVVKLELTRHYLVIAEQSYKDGKMHECLGYLRKSFEEILHRIWKKLGDKNFNVLISVGMRSPKGAPDLRSVANGLYAFLSKPEVSIYKNVVPILDTMIAKDKTHAVEWSQLNKGAHEEDKAEEFDKAIVKEIFDLMVQIDDVVKNGGKVIPAPALLQGSKPQ
ncbi:AAA family ATPase [Undibacterium sp. RuTC16W]|uniref:AAA family ATPase n=1 Tax=Undibacterium sp. RuTC16W TaxID=3413048 RepID=UPI003BF35001